MRDNGFEEWAAIEIAVQNTQRFLTHEGKEGRDDQDYRSRSDALKEVIISDHARSPNNKTYFSFAI